MEQWAKAWPSCHFLCLCTAGDDEHKLSGEAAGNHASANYLASAMAARSGLEHCVNAVVEAPEALTHPFSQLGCSGFIVLDAEHNVVCAKTSAYLTMKSWAFKHVDALLDATTRGVPAPRVCPGEMVTLQGPAAKEYDGSRALCLTIGDKYNAGKMEVAVQPSGKKMWLPHSVLLNESYEELKARTNPGGCCSCKCSDVALKPMQPLATVQMPSLDAEHEACVSAVNKLVESSSVEDLRAVHTCFSKHFEHEEELMQQAGFGGGDPRFCARTSHGKDHTRIIAYIEQCINDAAATGEVPKKAIQQVMTDLAEHAAQYDDQYVECLAQHDFT